MCLFSESAIILPPLWFSPGNTGRSKINVPFERDLSVSFHSYLYILLPNTCDLSSFLASVMYKNTNVDVDVDDDDYVVVEVESLVLFSRVVIVSLLLSASIAVVCRADILLLITATPSSPRSV